MSTSLAPVNVANTVVGATFTIDFTPFVKVNTAQAFGRRQGPVEHAHLQLYNDSHVGFSWVANASGKGGYIPAGGWQTIQVDQNDSQVILTVTYVLSNPQVTLVMPTYFAPGEEVPAQPTLGNSPIGIGGNVATTNISSLSNEGAASNTLVIDMGDSGFSQLLTMYNDGHCLWQVDQSGVKHQAIKIQTSGNPLQLGVSGDTSEVLGNLVVDGTLTSTGDATFNGAGNGVTVTNNALVSGTSTFTGDVTHTGKLIANGAATVINGSVAGTVSFFTPVWGTALKILIILTSTNYNDVTAHTFIFPSVLTAGMVYMGNMGTTTVAFKNGATAENTDVTTTLGGSSAGAHSNLASIKSDSLGMFDATGQADRVTFTPGGAISNGVFILIGA